MRKHLIGLALGFGLASLAGAVTAQERVDLREGVVACNGAGAVAYPRAARRERAQGTVTLKVFVAPHGRAEQVSLEKSSGHFVLDRAARIAAKSTALCLLDGVTPAKPGWADLRVSYRLNRLYADL